MHRRDFGADKHLKFRRTGSALRRIFWPRRCRYAEQSDGKTPRGSGPALFRDCLLPISRCVRYSGARLGLTMGRLIPVGRSGRSRVEPSSTGRPVSDLPILRSSNILDCGYADLRIRMPGLWPYRIARRAGVQAEGAPRMSLLWVGAL